MPSRPSVRGALSSDDQDARTEVGLELQTPSSTLRQHLDEDALPRPEYFDSLDDLHTWYEFRFGDAADDHLQPCSRHQGALDTQESPITSSTSFQRKSSHLPKLAVCHDFQGGYGERPDARGYSFEHFHLVDTFIYFSHKRITIPPSGWIQAARRFNTKMLGTIIFEWKESIPEMSKLLRGPERKAMPLRGAVSFSPQYAVELIELALERGFSGYLVNVEVSLDLGFACSGELWPAWVGEQVREQEMSKNAERLRAWVHFLRSEGKKRFIEAGRPEEEWEVMWYDSVTYPSGRLAWQDALTPYNVDYFQAADSFFTNYTWARPPQPLPPGQLIDPDDPDPQILQLRGFGLTGPDDGGFHPNLTLTAALTDSLDRPRNQVYVGIDVFARNCWGGLDTWRSLDMIGPHRHPSTSSQEDLASTGESLGLSIALFAPGWTWEHEEPSYSSLVSRSSRSWKEWWEEERSFWIGPDDAATLRKKAVQSFFSHSVADQGRIWRALSQTAAGFFTSFALGSGKAWWHQGRKVFQWQKEQASISSKRIPGWTDMGASLPKPDLLFSFPSSSVIEWWYDETDVYCGNVSLGLKVTGDADIPLCTVPICLGNLDDTISEDAVGEGDTISQTWEYRIAFKASAGMSVCPRVVDAHKAEEPTATEGVTATSRQNSWKETCIYFQSSGRSDPNEPRVLHLGISVNSRSDGSLSTGTQKVLIGGLQLRRIRHTGRDGRPEGATSSSSSPPQVQLVGIKKSSAHEDQRKGKLLSGTLEWRPFKNCSAPYYDVWMQEAGNQQSENRIWLGTSTREATTEEFCFVELNVHSLLSSHVKRLEFVVTPVCIGESEEARVAFDL